MTLRTLSGFFLGTLRGRLIFSVAAVHAVMMALFIGDLTERQRAMLLDHQTEEASALSQALATSAAGWIAANDVSGLQELVEAQRRHPEILFVILTDREGHVLADSDKSRQGQYLLDLPREVRHTVLLATPALVDVAAPALVGGRQVGWARVGIGQESAGEKLAEITRDGIIYALAAILVGSFIAWFMGRRITRRLYAVQETFDAVRSGNRLARSKISGGDEAAVLAHEFNAMLDAMAERDAELSNSEKRYRSLISKVQTAIVLHDGQGRVVNSNPLARELLGLSADQLLGKTLIDPAWRFVHEDGSVLPAAEYPASKVLSTRQPLRGLVAGISRPDRQDIVWVLVNAEPEYDDAGIALVIVSFMDITERRRMEQEVARVASFPMRNPNPVTEADLDGRVSFANPAARRLFPDLEQQGPGHPWLKDWQTIAAACLGEGGKPDYREVAVAGRWYHQTMYYVPEERRLRIYGYDITERKRAEEQLRRSEYGLAEAQHIAHLGNWELNLTNNVLIWSEEIYRIFEIDPEQFGASYETFLNAIHPEDREMVNKAYTDSVTNKVPYDIVHRVKMPDGRIKYVNEICETYYGEDSKPLRSVGTVHDITERKLAEEALHRLNRELRAISSCNQVLMRAEDEQALLDSICRIICDEAGYRMAWVGYAENDDAKSISPVAWAGTENGYLAEARLTWADTERGCGPSGIAVRSGESASIQDFASDPGAAPWRDRALQRGYRSSIAMPLKDKSANIFGVLNVYSAEPNAFTAEERRLLGELAGDLAFGIMVLRTRIERQRAEAALDEAQQVSRALIENSPDIIARYDRDCRRTYVNSAYLKTAQIPEQELLATAPVQLSPLPAQSAAILQDLLRRVLDSGFAEAVDVEWLKADKVVHWYNIFAFPEVDRQGRVVSVMTVSRDITVRKQTEEALRESDKRYKQLLDSVTDYIYTVQVRDGRSVATAHGPGCLAVTGYTPEAYAADPDLWYRMVFESDRGVVTAQAAGILAGKAVAPLEHRIRHRDGSLRWVRNTCVPRYDQHGHLLGYDGLIADITQRKQAEEEVHKLNQELELRVTERTAELEAANKELEAFAFSVSHDLRAPLRHIDGFVELLQERTAATPDEQSRHYMATITKAARRMEALIDDILSFSRMGRAEMAKSQVGLGGLVQEVIRELEAEIRDRTVDWHVSELPTVTGDRAMLRVALANLISNALKFTRPRERAEIEIACEAGHEGEVVVFVRDNGVGFDMRYAEKLFGVFQRLHREEEFEGTGIGLANVRRVIGRHGGRTWAEGKVDGGATFYFSVPRTT